MQRRTSRSDLLRLGFVAVDDAAEALDGLGPYAAPLRPALARVADPDAALRGLTLLASRVEDRAAFFDGVLGVPDVLARLLAVLGASPALSDHLLRWPQDWRELADPELSDSRATAAHLRSQLVHAVAGLPDAEALDALRLTYRRLLLRLAARDLAHNADVEDVGAELSDLAAGALEAALVIARARVGVEADGVRFAVIALGKCGGHELNYVSDVDVVFVHEAVGETDEQTAAATAARLASHLIRICSEPTAAGVLWPVDANLRPEGTQGPLSRTLASHRAYYARWARTWEFQALLKARPVAGDADLGAAYGAMSADLVWQAATRDGFVEDVQEMRRRVVAHLPAQEAERQLKLGAGGLRDVEFAVQLLQMVHGRVDDSLHASSTLVALRALTAGGYVGREDGRQLQEAYRFLRRLEHRIQLRQLRRSHVVPEEPEALRRLGRSLGLGRDAATALEREWRSHRREVRRLHEKLFYRPLLAAASRLPADEAVLSPQAARSRLAALGYADPASALRHLEALTGGLSRSASIQRTLLPVMLGWFADAPDPDAGLLGFRRISEALGSTTWYLRLLRDEGEVAERMARILATSRYATDLLQREPHGVRLLAGDLATPGAGVVLEEMRSVASRAADSLGAVRAIRAVRRRELFRIAVRDLVGRSDVVETGQALSVLTDATLEATLEAVMHHVGRERGFSRPPSAIAIVAMGRYGGAELSYGSDVDVMFVHEPRGEATVDRAAAYAQEVALEVRRLLALPGSDPALDLDADLRPEGRQGPLVRTLDSYAAYYAKWSRTWEAQALLRADAVVGDQGLRQRFTALIDPIRFPTAGLDDEGVYEVRRLKARIDAERLPRGADPHTHLKLGRGGLADIEWTVQLLQMRHAATHQDLRTPRTLDALQAAMHHGLLSAGDAQALMLAWRLVSRVRDAMTLVRGRPGDQLPADARERAAVAAVLGYAPGGASELLNDYLRTTRRARAVVDRVFWE